jgi:putative ABC transport system ATP-binding protein
MNDGQPLVAATRLRHMAGGREILRLDSLEIMAGRHTLLLGRSGSGKTTLINILCGLVTPTEGEVRIAGADMGAMTAGGRDDLRRRTIGLVFQTIRLIPALSVRQNLELAQRVALGSVDRRAVDSLIAAVGLSHRADAKPRRISQGESQRAAIARALITKPKLVIADEPTSALDDENAAMVLDLLFRVAADTGATLLVATHDRRIRDRFAATVLIEAPALRLSASRVAA